MNTPSMTKRIIDWRQVLLPSVVSILVFTVISGLLYPLAITALAQVAFPHQANGSLITNTDGQAIGSTLIGQQFSNPAYFWGRPSVTSPTPYNGAASAASNYGPLNPALIGPDGLVQTRLAALREANAAAGVTVNQLVPVDLVTASASGLDPHISPAAAEYQVTRIAAVRKAAPAQIRQLVAHYTEGRTLGLFGEPHINVLQLNIALDAQFPLAKGQ